MMSFSLFRKGPPILSFSLGAGTSESKEKEEQQPQTIRWMPLIPPLKKEKKPLVLNSDGTLQEHPKDALKLQNYFNDLLTSSDSCDTIRIPRKKLKDDLKLSNNPKCGAIIHAENKKLKNIFLVDHSFDKGTGGQITILQKLPDPQWFVLKIIKISNESKEKTKKLEEKALNEYALAKEFGLAITAVKRSKKNEDYLEIIMHYIPGYNWFDEIVNLNDRQKTLNPLILIKRFINALTILKKMHDANCLHRDIKSENFMVLGEDVYLVDFGHTVKLNKEAKTYPNPTMEGTLGYLDPEMFDSGKNSFATDIYALNISIADALNFIAKKSTEEETELRKLINKPGPIEPKTLNRWIKFQEKGHYLVDCKSESFQNNTTIPDIEIRKKIYDFIKRTIGPPKSGKFIPARQRPSLEECISFFEGIYKTLLQTTTLKIAIVNLNDLKEDKDNSAKTKIIEKIQSENIDAVWFVQREVHDVKFCMEVRQFFQMHYINIGKELTDFHSYSDLPALLNHRAQREHPGVKLEYTYLICKNLKPAEMDELEKIKLIDKRAKDDSLPSAVEMASSLSAGIKPGTP